MKRLAVGIGCRANSPAEQIEAAVLIALDSLSLDSFAFDSLDSFAFDSSAFGDISVIASIDSKADEPGLLAFCAQHALPLVLFSRERIAAIEVSAPSAATRTHFGVDGVCEPCALLAALDSSEAPEPAAGTPGQSGTPTITSRLVVPKTVHAGVTVAIAIGECFDNDTRPQDFP